MSRLTAVAQTHPTGPQAQRTVWAMCAFVDELVRAPNGVLLLAWLEAEHHSDRSIGHEVENSDPLAVARAVESVSLMSFGEVVTHLVDAATRLGGPWNPTAVANLTHGYQHAAARLEIADAVASRFEQDLRDGPDLPNQEFWNCGHHLGASSASFRDFDRVYDNGEFTWAAVRTASPHPADSYVSISVTTDAGCELTTRWRLPVREDVRVWRVDGPSDWVRLVASYPRPAHRQHHGWELPGPNQRGEPGAGVGGLAQRSGGGAARTTIAGHLLPDWAAIAEDYDGVHLSWAGYLTTEGLVVDVDTAVTMLRYWDGEQTHWLADVFGEPEPLPPPPNGEGRGTNFHIDVRADPTRRDQDLEVILSMLGR
jgi:hypothetical protein